MIKKCKLCGKEFEATTNTNYCSGPHFRVCVVCGKEFEITPSQALRQTCSMECRVAYANKQREFTRSLKASQHLDPNKTKGGKYIRTCIICGEEFHTSSKTRVLCYKPHTRKCCMCGKEFQLKTYNPNTLTCSTQCASDLRVQRNLEKYGVRCTFQTEASMEKSKATSLAHYGVENPMSSPVVKARIKKTNLERRGVEWSVQSKEVQAKSQQTCVERFGVPYGCMSEQAKQKTRQTNLERRGVEYLFQDPEFQAQSRLTCMERYGTEFYIQSQDFREKAVATWMDHWGVDNPLKSPEVQKITEATSIRLYGTRRPQQAECIRSRIRQTNIDNHANKIPDEDCRREYRQFKLDTRAYLESYIRDNPTATPAALSSRLGFEDSTIILEALHEYGFDEWAANLSSMESAIVDFIHLVDPTIEVVTHDRKIISPKEIDLYLPQYKIGIECNPTTTHNTTISLGQIFGDKESRPIDRNYHRDKSIECSNKGVFLFHIFGYEWKSRPFVIKSMLRNLLNKDTYRYYARKLEVRQVPSEECKEFLNENHRQGYNVSKVNLGLYDGNDLVSVMTFGPTRPGMGRRKSDDSTVWELLRFCNKMNTSVVGGASKLFKYFLNHYTVSRVVSFSDVAHTRGNLYRVLGFTAVGTSDPGYGWVHLYSDLFLSRVSCQKQNLPKLFDEPDLDIVNQTEQQIMANHNFVQVFDSGVIRWEYKNS